MEKFSGRSSLRLMNTRNSSLSSVDFNRMSLRKCPRSSFISRFGASETSLGQAIRSSISCWVYRHGDVATSESSSQGVVAVQAAPHRFCARQVLHLLVQQLRVPADVESPFSQLAPVVHRLHPPVRRGRSRRLLILGHKRDQSLRLYVVAPPLSGHFCARK